MKVLRVLAIVVTLAFVALVLVGFDNVLALARSRVALFLLLAPLVGLFLWSVSSLVRTRKRSPRDYVDVTPRD